MSKQSTLARSPATVARKWPRTLAAMAVFGAGMVIGAATYRTPEARAEVRTTAPRDAFKSGGQLSLPLLQDIATTLHKIDGRLARMETTVQQIQADLNEGPHAEL